MSRDFGSTGNTVWISVVTLVALSAVGCGHIELPEDPVTGQTVTTPAGEPAAPLTPPDPEPDPEPNLDDAPTASTPPTPDRTPPPQQEPAPDALPEGRVPQRLVGEWDGDGPGPARLTKIAFMADGTAALYPNSGGVLSGTAVVSGSSMTIYVPGTRMVVGNWSIERFEVEGYVFENLLLDGVSYVRQISGG
ncbi:hypothetical protein [Streptomyces dubilierae]|uniref:Lipoprotein n=1 Tax=Streptomyces dubilierae TaxID=3075533 RepID=A0ABU2P2J7_9ACTN|nr:hypothetical protein [Streptomyces sp. DSM 41921]MDT0385968.1 hypothetical protein [Streptomyces sp. DSM 41921]